MLAGLTLILILGAFYGFFEVATGQNYTAHNRLRRTFVDHPEFIPTKETVKIGSVGMDTVVADFYWLSAIQYIGSNALAADYKKYLGVMLNLITDVSPHFVYPYQIGMLLIPDVNQRYERITNEEEKFHIDESIELGKKGIKNNCDAEKIEKIGKIYDLNRLFADESLMEPCTDAMLPYYLGYVSYWNNNDPVGASLWFRVAGMHKAAPKGGRLMSAIMQGKTGDREKAIIMFLSLAESMDPNPKSVCSQVTAQLRELLTKAFANGAEIDPKLLQQVEEIRKKAKEDLGDKQEEIDRTDVSAYCSSYFDKSVREMNLKFVQDADKRLFADSGEHAVNAKELFDKKYITYLPRDYQKQSAGEVIYFYNHKIKNWDFEMGEYE